MADNDTEIAMSIKAYTGDAVDSLKILDKAMESIQKQIDKCTPASLAYAQMFAKISKQVDMVNTTTLENKFKAIATSASKFTKQLQTKALTTFMGVLDNMANTMNKFNNSYNSLLKLKELDFSKFANLDTSNLSDINTDALEKIADTFMKMRNARIDMVSRSIDQFASGMKKMETLNFSPDTEKNIQSQMDATANTLKDFMKKLSDFNVDGFAKITTAMKSLPKAMQGMEKLNAEKVKQTFDTITQSLQSFLATLREGSDDIANFATVLKKMGGSGTRSTAKALQSVKKEVRDTGTEADKTKRKLNNMLSFGKVYAFYNQMRHYGRSFLNMLNQSIDFAEIENYFSRAMGNMRKEAMKFQDTLSETFGMATPAMMQAQATFKNMIGALGGVSDEVAYGLSERITKMVLDYSSLYNTTIDSAITKFQAALSKQVNFCPLCMGVHGEFLLTAGNLSL